MQRSACHVKRSACHVQRSACDSKGLSVMHHNCNHDSCAMTSCCEHDETMQTMLMWCSCNANTNDIMPHHSYWHKWNVNAMTSCKWEHAKHDSHCISQQELHQLQREFSMGVNESPCSILHSLVHNKR